MLVEFAKYNFNLITGGGRRPTDEMRISVFSKSQMPEGQAIGGKPGQDFLDAWRAKAQVTLFLAPSQDPAISVSLRQEYRDFYESIGFPRTAADARNALGGANPNKKAKQAVRSAHHPHTVARFSNFFEQACNAKRADTMTGDEKVATAARKHDWKQVVRV